MQKTNFFLFFFISIPVHAISTSPSPTEHWIIIHGTFAQKASWYKTDSDECKALTETLLSNSLSYVIHPFSWSGEHNHKARVKAAAELVRLIKHLDRISKKRSEHITFHLVGHSHGATIMLLAIEELFETNRSIRIAECFALGMPVHEAWYPHCSEQIDALYNFFSYGDNVQRVGPIFERTLIEKNSVYNIQVIYDHLCPGHCELYKPLFLKQLPLVRTYLKEKGPYVMHFHSNSYPECLIGIDSTREQDLAADKNFTEQLIKILADSRKKKA